MDALALLCTLHADGPTTLRLLRDAGCTSLDDLARVRAERLADLLGVSPARGRRFLREAESLADRLQDRALDAEESAHEPAPAVPRRVDRDAPRATPSARTSSAVPNPRGLDRTDRRVLERVIDRWREEEARESAADRATEPAPALPASEHSAADPRRDFAAGGSGLRTTVDVDVDVEVAPAPADGTPLAAGALDGLDADLCGRLRGAGVATVEALAGCDPLDLARTLGVPFTQLRRLQFLAVRHVPATTREREPRREERLSPSFAAPAHPTPEAADGPAGPFA